MCRPVIKVVCMSMLYSTLFCNVLKVASCMQILGVIMKHGHFGGVMSIQTDSGNRLEYTRLAHTKRARESCLGKSIGCQSNAFSELTCLPVTIPAAFRSACKSTCAPRYLPMHQFGIWQKSIPLERHVWHQTAAAS